MTHEVAPTSAETVELETALNHALSSLGMRRDPVSRAVAATRVQELLTVRLTQVSELRRRAVASAVASPGMSMQKVADELGVSKSAVAKLAGGTAEVRERIAAEMRAHLASSGESPTSDERLQEAFRYGAGGGERHR